MSVPDRPSNPLPRWCDDDRRYRFRSLKNRAATPIVSIQSILEGSAIKTLPALSLDTVFAKVAGPAILVFVLAVAGIAYAVPHLLRQNVIDSETKSAEATVNQFKTLRKYYVKNVIGALIGKSDIKASFNHEGVDKTVPLPATVIHDLSAMLSESGTSVTLYSEFPFPNRGERVLDSFAGEALTYLNANPDASFVRTEQVNGANIVRVAIADRMVAESCVNCHNSHPQSPKLDWKLGDVRGVLEVATSIDQQLANGVATSNKIVGILVAVGLLILAIIHLSLRIRVTRPLNAAAAAAERVAVGDLTGDIRGGANDEVGRVLHSLAKMQGKLVDVVADIKDGTKSIALSTGEISQGTVHLSQRTEQQAASLQKTAASMQEMTGSVKQNATSAEQANRLSSEAQERAESGVSVVGQTVEAMEKINVASRRIADIIGVIDEIAFQTNLLALNAAVEAARAGEQGRGFAVVASEVRNLAQRSASAAKEIKVLIEDSVDKVRGGSDLVGRSGETLEEIVSVVQQVSDLMSEIAAASREQSLGIEQVNRAVREMDDMTNQNAALAEETTSASEAMVGQTVGLDRLIAFFETSDSAAAAAGLEQDSQFGTG